jgi:hypothetical protein
MTAELDWRSRVNDALPLYDAVRNYCASYNIPCFEMPEPKKWKAHADAGGWWGSNESAKSGCYAIYSDQGALIYIGKASLTTHVGSRVAVHERSLDERFRSADFVQIINVHHSFEAPSLEEYLITKLRPQGNKNGIKGKPTLDALVGADVD